MDEINADEMIVEWKTPNSSEFGSLESSCVKRLEFELASTDEIINGIGAVAITGVDDDDAVVVGAATTKCTNGNADGNDSGVDTGATVISSTNPPIQLQRALSNNSAGYASSSGGHDAQFASCNSSLLSVCSDSHDGKITVMSCKGSIDCTSENGSESSSVSGDKHNNSNNNNGRLRQTPPKKRVGVIDPNQSKLSPRSCDSSVSGASSSNSSSNKARIRATSANRALNGRALNFCAPNLATTERARSRDKQITPNSQSSPTKRTKPSTLSTNIKMEMTPAKSTTATLRRAASVTRRTPTSCTPSTEDGRWPSIQLRSASKTPNRTTVAAVAAAAANESLVIKTKIGPIVLDNKPVDRFSTMPRRQKKVKSQEDLSEWRSNRSSSTTRDRMSVSTIVRRFSTREAPNKSTTTVPPRYQKTSGKTLIFHEAAIQTAITSQDIDDAFAGNPRDIQIDAIPKVDRNCQVDIRDREIEELEERIKMMSAENKTLRQNLVERSQILTNMEQQMLRERDEKKAMEKELQSNTERVLGMLELVHAAPSTPSSSETDAAADATAAAGAVGGGAGACDSLLMLESQIQLSGHALEQKQTEINTLRKFCNQLQAEMNRSRQVQLNLLEEKKTFEKESSELQDFLQDEKTAIFEALKDAESELEEYQVKMKVKEAEVERLQDECRHLVRISEQRRQEYLGMQTKYAALESKSRVVVAHQNHAVSGATLALSDLSARLTDLVEQLIASYNISEQELEDEIYHNEAYAHSEESSPDSERRSIINGSNSPQRNHSFVAAVINAIRSAATTAKEKVNQKKANKSHGSGGGVTNENGGDATSEMLDSETEPCLMMENVLEDVSMPDSHTHNLISSSMIASIHSLDDGGGGSGGGAGDNQADSLHNLCEAIANRQKIEQQTSLMMMNQSMHSERDGTHDCDALMNVSHCERDVPVEILVDHVIDVDNLVTKLLKVLRIIQMDNDNCIQQLINEKNTLQLNSEETMDKLRETDDLNEKLIEELESKTVQLINSSNDLAHSHSELMKSRREINKLNEDICNLSILCSTAKTQSKDEKANGYHEISNEYAQIIETRNTSNSQDEMPNDVVSINSVRNSAEMTKLNGFELNSNKWSNGTDDVACQNDAITKTIETLNGIQSIVRQCPALVDLQRDLEQMLPSDCNANVE